MKAVGVNGVELKNMFNKNELLKVGSEFDVQAVDFTLGPEIKFAYDEKQGIVINVPQHPKLEIDNEALRHMLRGIGIPETFGRKTPEEYFPPLLNYYWQEEKAEQGARILVKDNKCVGTSLTPRNNYVSVPQLIDETEKALKGDILGYHRANFSWFKTTINTVLTETFEIATKDPMNIGIRWMLWPNELHPPQALLYIFRQWCSNGAVTQDDIASFRCSRDNASEGGFRKWVDSVVVESKEAVKLEKVRLQRLLDTPTNKNTAAVLDHILKAGHVNNKLREEVGNRAIDAETETMYDVYNILTETATFSDVSVEGNAITSALEVVVAGLSNHVDLCKACNRPLDI